MGGDTALRVVDAWEASQRGESWEDQTMRGNRLLPTCEEAKDALRALGINTSGGDMPLANGGALNLTQRERDLVNEAVDMALAAERASHQAEIASLMADRSREFTRAVLAEQELAARVRKREMKDK